MISFAQPWFLTGLAALAVPVFIHLIQRRRAQPVRFPSIRFIPGAPVPRQGRRRLHDWLLLFLRLLAYACLILLLAQPEWVTPSESVAPTDTQPTILVLDASLSLQAGDRWAEAQQAFADEAAQATGPVGAVAYARQVFARRMPGENAAALAREIEPRPEAGQPAGAVRAALSMLESAGGGEIVVISDFQASNWGDVMLPAMPESVNLRFRGVGAPVEQNAALVDVRAFPVDGETKRVLADVANTGTQALEAAVTLEADGTSWFRPVQLEPGERSTVVFEVPPPRDPMATVRLSEDGFAADNERVFWAGSRPFGEVGIFLPDGFFESDEAFFTGKAISIHRPSDWMRFAPSELDLSFMREDILDGMPAIVIPGVTSAAPAIDWTLVHNYVEKGGLAFVLLSADAVRTLRELRAVDLLEARYGGIANIGNEDTAVSWINPQSRLADVFEGEAARDLLLLELRRHVILEETGDAVPLLKTADGHPVLLRRSIGAGQVIVSAFPWGPHWSDLPLRNAFLPLVQELLKWSRDEGGDIVQLTTGEPLPSELAGALPENPGPGVYLAGEQPVEVHVPLSESEMASLAEDQRSQMLENLRRDPAVFAGSGGEEHEPLPLWPYLLAGAMIAFILENLLAANFGEIPAKTASGASHQRAA